MVRRIHELLAIVLMLGGLGGVALSFLFLYDQRFIEGFTAGFLALLVLRAGLLVLRLVMAWSALGESHARLLGHIDAPRGKEGPRRQ